MFVLRTGLMGNGKTINTIKEVDLRALAQGRTVYYHNITKLQPSKLQANWVEFDDPHKWFELPKDAIIVIDEAQMFFRVRSSSSQVPAYASALEVMRKQGHELHCITQHPSLIDHHFKNLCNKHIHYNRLFGSNRVSRWEFETTSNVKSSADFARGQRFDVTIDPKYFDVYESAQAAHHFKIQIPKAAYVLAACLVLVVVGAAYVYKSRVAVSEPEPLAVTGPVTVSDSMPISTAVPVVTADDYIRQRQPRIAAIPASAPIYDELTRAQSFPRPMCISTSDSQLLARSYRQMEIGMDDGAVHGCRCNSQQGTRMSVEFAACMDIVRNGYFDAARPDRHEQQQPDIQLAPNNRSGGRDGEPARRTPDAQIVQVASGNPGHLW